MKKRIVIIALILAMLFTFGACQKENYSFNDIKRAIKRSTEPYDISTKVTYTIEGEKLESTSRLQMKNTSEGIIAKYVWNKQAFNADVTAQENVLTTQGEDYYSAEKYYDGVEWKTGEELEGKITASFEIDEEYFSNVTIYPVAGGEAIFEGTLTAEGLSAIFGADAATMSNATLTVVVGVEVKNMVTEIEVEYTANTGATVQIAITFGYEQQEVTLP